MSDSDSMDMIRDFMDGVEWTSDTLDGIAKVIRDSGRVVRDVADAPEYCPTCGADSPGRCDHE